MYKKMPNLPVKGTKEQVTAVSAARHVHHGPDFGQKPGKYGMNNSDLKSISNNRLRNHIANGGKAPTLDHVRDLQIRWKSFAEHPNMTRFENQTVMGKNAIVIKNITSGQFVAFETLNRKSITGYKLSERQSIKHDKTGIIGRDFSKN